MLKELKRPTTHHGVRRQVQAAGLLGRYGWCSVPMDLITLAVVVASLILFVAVPGVGGFGAVPLLAVF